MQAPGGKGEAPSDHFGLEGWSVPYFDEATGVEMGKQMGVPFDLLLGRKTYDVFAGYWPHQEGFNPINTARKYVVTSRPFSMEWKEPLPIQGDVVGEIRKLKQQDGPMLQVHGSSQLIQTLLENDLADELWLKIFPVVLGKGKRLFGSGAVPAAYQLTGSTVTPSGILVAAYQRAGEVQLGSF
mgnify:FL=1